MSNRQDALTASKANAGGTTHPEKGEVRSSWAGGEGEVRGQKSDANDADPASGTEKRKKSNDKKRAFDETHKEHSK